jgi:hypothetical protein
MYGYFINDTCVIYNRTKLTLSEWNNMRAKRKKLKSNTRADITMLPKMDLLY